ncbi:hypothetical protein EDC01DRAFT_646351 [Geopyxis carbonaria]|nr:hypothetical protein EDC01DRAFT_646351 [Geopyxis carbonaria]
MTSNKRRRSSDSDSSSYFKYTAVEPSSMLIKLPSSQISQTCPKKRRSPLTLPSVTPPSVTMSEHTTQQEKDRCQSSSRSRAASLLAKVAVVGSQPSAPTSPRNWTSGCSPESSTSSMTSSPTSTPREESDQFHFDSSKQLTKAQEYVSFPVFETFGGCKQNEGDCADS